MSGYDQWKTASPYDDEPDPIDEAQSWLKQHPEDPTKSPEESEIQWARTVIECLLELIDEEL